MFNYKFALVPLSIVRMYRMEGSTILHYRVLYLFGIRLAYWTCSN